MAAPVNLVNGGPGPTTTAHVDMNHAVRVANDIPDTPSVGEGNRLRYFNDYVYNGINPNMAVDGSINPVAYTISSSPDYDLYITKVIILIASNTIANNKFGDVAALTNGWSLFVVEQGLTTYIVDEATTTGELTIESGGVPLDLSNWNPANDNARSISVDISVAFPHTTSNGIRIGRGSKDEFTGLVQDSLVGLSELSVRVIGARHYPVESIE